jgi:hypothetical protein
LRVSYGAMRRESERGAPKAAGHTAGKPGRLRSVRG